MASNDVTFTLVVRDSISEVVDRMRDKVGGTTQVIRVQWWLSPIEKRYRGYCKGCGWKAFSSRLTLGASQNDCAAHRAEKGCPR